MLWGCDRENTEKVSCDWQRWCTAVDAWTHLDSWWDTNTDPVWAEEFSLGRWSLREVNSLQLWSYNHCNLYKTSFLKVLNRSWTLTSAVIHPQIIQFFLYNIPQMVKMWESVPAGGQVIKLLSSHLKRSTWSLHLDLQGHGTAGMQTSAELQLPVIVFLYFSLETREPAFTFHSLLH